MGRVVVDVMPKPEILDPQGKAVAAALPRLGFARFSGVRQGKRFELEVDGEVTQDVLDEARRAAETLLSNPVIEDVIRVVRAEEADPSADRGPAADAEREAEQAGAEEHPVPPGTTSAGGTSGPRRSHDAGAQA